MHPPPIDAGSWIAGATPKIKPVTIAASVVNASVQPSTWRRSSMRDARQRQAGQRARPEHRERQAKRRAGARQHDAFGQHLRDQAAAARAQREADRDLLLTRGRARQQQVRQVRAHDQHHDADRAREHDQRGSEAARHVIRQRAHSRAERIPLGMIALEPRRDAQALGPRRIQRDTRAAAGRSRRACCPTYSSPRSAASADRYRGGRRARAPSRNRTRRAARRPPCRPFVERHRAADDAWIGSEAAAPQRVAQHHRARSVPAAIPPP